MPDFDLDTALMASEFRSHHWRIFLRVDAEDYPESIASDQWVRAQARRMEKPHKVYATWSRHGENIRWTIELLQSFGHQVTGEQAGEWAMQQWDWTLRRRFHLVMQGRLGVCKVIDLQPLEDTNMRLRGVPNA